MSIYMSIDGKIINLEGEEARQGKVKLEVLKILKREGVRPEPDGTFIIGKREDV